MGKLNNILSAYFSDNERYADLYNGLCFAGNTVICGEMLEELPCRYDRTESEGNGRRTAEYLRDLIRRCRWRGFSGICAVELQETVDYTMPWRILNYDALEYRRQIKMLKRENRGLSHRTVHERFCGLLREDRLVPVHTVCLYHGTARWDGPRSLGDMLKQDKVPGQDISVPQGLLSEQCDLWERFRALTADYAFHLVCLNEISDMSIFRTPVRLVLEVLRLREDRKALREEFEKRNIKIWMRIHGSRSESSWTGNGKG